MIYFRQKRRNYNASHFYIAVPNEVLFFRLLDYKTSSNSISKTKVVYAGIVF